jgi:hypothetical protein
VRNGRGGFSWGIIGGIERELVVGGVGEGEREEEGEGEERGLS